MTKKWVLILAVVCACIIGLATQPVRLGLDLRGGSHIVLQVQVQDAFKAEADSIIERLKQDMRKANIAYVSIDRNDPASAETADTVRIDIRGVLDTQSAELRRIVDAAAAGWTLSSEGTGAYKIALTQAAAQQLRDDTLQQSISTIERRVNGLGVAESSVQRRGGSGGEDGILVQLPGVDDAARIKASIQASALLELTEVKDGPFPSRDAALSAHGGVLPLGTKLVSGAESWWLLARSPVVTGRDLRNAVAQPGDIPGRWDTGFTLTQDAAQRFERFTGANIGKRLAIVLDNHVLSAPSIDAQISDRGRIMGAGTQQEASDLALNLRAGSLPAGVKVGDERRVGPSLGADSIRSGITAGVTGLALIVAAIVLYYRGAGINAVLALLLNAALTIAALSYIGTAWTLPGIAGLLLSIGMSVDSNILIFERIKEELRAGKSAAAAVAAGFERAFATILDTHVTTVVASAFLFVFGTGPVRGFAVTLVIGLLANLFTAVFVSRAMFDLQLRRGGARAPISIGGERTELFRQTHIDFLSRRWLMLGLSAAAIIVSIGSLVLQGGPKYGLDFRGGTLIRVKVEPQPGLEDVRQTLDAKVKGEFSLQEARESGEIIVGTSLANEETLEDASRTIEQALREKYAVSGGKVEIRSGELVSPKASEEMRTQAGLATAGALGGMLAYVALRFKLVSGVAAVIATIHDVVITLGLISLTGREIDLTVIAALLTLIGYSMNDKIVVFDRVRENLRGKRRGSSFFDVVNESINQTLSRTILTGGLTLLACVALYLLGGKVLNGIAFALCTGIIAGTYSSIFVASALLVWWESRRSGGRRVPAGELEAIGTR